MKTHKMSPMMRQKVLQIIMFCVFKYVKACCSLGSNEVSQQDSATTVMMGKYGQQDDSDCDDYCCSTENKCEKGQGHCEKHEECKSNLRCGEHNCKEGKKLRNENNCCTDICRGWNNCCSKERPCGLGEGNCKTNADCIPTLICGEAGNSCNKTTDFQVNDRCCIRPTTTPTTCKRGYCCEKKPCNLNEGICAAHNQCLGNLLCGRQNCKHKKRGLLSTDRCCRAPTCGTADEDKCEKGWGCNFKDEECRANMYCVEKAKFIEQKINPSCSTDKKFENIKACCYPGCFHRNITVPFEDCCTKERKCKYGQGPCRNPNECDSGSCGSSCSANYRITAKCCASEGGFLDEVTINWGSYTPVATTPLPEEEKLLIVGGQRTESGTLYMTNFSYLEDLTTNANYTCDQPANFPNFVQNAIIGLEDKKILVCGGENTEEKIVYDECFFYTNNAWIPTKSLTSKRTSVFYTQSSYGLVIAGGHPVSEHPMKNLEVLYGGKWVQITDEFFPDGHWGGCACPLEEKRTGFINGHTSSFYYFGKFYDNRNIAPFTNISNIFVSFNWVYHNVTTHNPTNLARLYPGCTTIKKKLYVIGGYTKYYKKTVNAKGQFTEYFPLTDLDKNGTWTSYGDFSEDDDGQLLWWRFFTTVKRNYFKMDVMNDFILLFDGEVTKYDTAIMKFDGKTYNLINLRMFKTRIHSSAMLISVENFRNCRKKE